MKKTLPIWSTLSDTEKTSSKAILKTKPETLQKQRNFQNLIHVAPVKHNTGNGHCQIVQIRCPLSKSDDLEIFLTLGFQAAHTPTLALLHREQVKEIKGLLFLVCLNGGLIFIKVSTGKFSDIM